MDDLLQDNWTADAIRDRLEAESRERDMVVSRDVWEMVSRRDSNRRVRSVVAALPDEPTEVEGLVYQITQEINLFRRLNLEDNAIGRSILKDLAREAYVEVIIREDVDPIMRLVFEFTFYLPARVLAQTSPKIRQSMRALAALRPVRLMTGQHFWVGDTLESV